MSDRRMTSYRLLLLRSALGRLGRSIAYYWVSLRTQFRLWRSSYHVTLFGQRLRGAAAATGRVLLSLPRRFVALLGLVVWFVRQLPPYLRRVLADRREDRMELRAERRLIAAQRRARRRAELTEIKAARAERPHHLQVPAWITRMERPERPVRERRVRAPRRALLAAVLTLVAAVPAYSVVSGALSSDDQGGAVPAAETVDPTAAAGAPTAGPVVVSGDTGEFVRTLPPLPTAAPEVSAPPLVVATPTAPPGGAAVVGSLTNPLTAHEAREARRQAKWEAKLSRAQAAADKKDSGK